MTKHTILSAPHIAPLTRLVHRWRTETGLDVPYFDPCDAGINAKILLLFEKPGPRSSTSGGSGFISQDNDDPTAAATKAFLLEAGIPRSDVVIWNTISTWNGTRRIGPGERTTAPMHIRELIAVLPQLKATILVGKEAASAITAMRSDDAGLLAGCHIVQSLHPSPINRGRRRAEWAQIPEIWRTAREALAGTAHGAAHPS